jgi:hypothetical protein
LDLFGGLLDVSHRLLGLGEQHLQFAAPTLVSFTDFGPDISMVRSLHSSHSSSKSRFWLGVRRSVKAASFFGMGAAPEGLSYF